MRLKDIPAATVFARMYAATDGALNAAVGRSNKLVQPMDGVGVSQSVNASLEATPAVNATCVNGPVATGVKAVIMDVKQPQNLVDDQANAIFQAARLRVGTAGNLTYDVPATIALVSSAFKPNTTLKVGGDRAKPGVQTSND